ncbi:hypothetical protein BDN71DRAFT_1432221 [Pleurotus eryngii]|uniref:Uncharacterized protein n=1 Tax=Pleurotus eryngii TaxID=5323 RepID=A0A9P6DFL9_PLEER|nr:hypothetical protein BDN71DRAFT_1432221 [Pleurotus eryngii]
MYSRQTLDYVSNMLLPSDRNMAKVQLSKTLPSVDRMACTLGLFSALAPLNPVLTEFGIGNNPNTSATVTEYKYDTLENCNVNCDEIHCASGSFLSLGASMNVVTADFSTTEGPNMPTLVRKYEYQPSEGSDNDSKMESDDEEGWATAMLEEDTDREDGGWFTAVSHFSNVGDMEVYRIDKGHFTRQQASVQPLLFPLTSVKSWGPRESR